MHKEQMTMKRCLVVIGLAAVLLLMGNAWGAEVKNVTAVQRWPWNGKVDVRFEVEGELPAIAALVVTAEDRTAGKSYTASSTALSGDTGKEAGTHHVIWDLDAQGVSFQSTNVVFTASYQAALYCVLDLAGGANAAVYPVSHLAAPPSGGFNTDAYKTTKLVLRRIDSQGGTPFFIGVFEVTQKQYQLVTGSNPSKFSGAKRPVEQVSWNTIRGNYNWPNNTAVDANSFMGRLRARTGLIFDMPTEAQWKYACQAGATTTYSYGNNPDGKYMWYKSNSSEQTHDVGTKQPNSWGLYDMHGNVWECCLDWLPGFESYYREAHGGSFESTDCATANRFMLPPTSSYSSTGFRLVRTLSD